MTRDIISGWGGWNWFSRRKIIHQRWWGRQGWMDRAIYARNEALQSWCNEINSNCWRLWFRPCRLQIRPREDCPSISTRCHVIGQIDDKETKRWLYEGMEKSCGWGWCCESNGVDLRTDRMVIARTSWSFYLVALNTHQPTHFSLLHFVTCSSNLGDIVIYIVMDWWTTLFKKRRSRWNWDSIEESRT